MLNGRQRTRWWKILFVEWGWSIAPTPAQLKVNDYAIARVYTMPLEGDTELLVL
jgi:hypothetical protein